MILVKNSQVKNFYSFTSGSLKGQHDHQVGRIIYRKALLVHHETIQYGALLCHDG
jgi:hypothetical protein